jgi:hypothetical protein
LTGGNLQRHATLTPCGSRVSEGFDFLPGARS